MPRYATDIDAPIPAASRRGFFRRRHSALCVAAIASLTLVSSSADTFAQNGSAFNVKVLNLADEAERITVPLFESVVIETSLEVTRADVTGSRIADVQVISPTRLLVVGQGYGSTNIILQGADQQQHVFAVVVELNLGRLNDAIRKIDPLADVLATSVLGNIVLTGTVSSAERAARIVETASLFLPPAAGGGQQAAVQNHLDVAGEQQVLLRVVVAEVNRAATRELGVNGFLAGQNFRDGFLVNQIGGINPINIGAAAAADVTQNLPFLTGEDGIPLSSASTLSLGFPRVQMQLFIKAMADNSLLRVLAEPNLVAISGETATFLAGGEFPIPVPQGNQTVTIDFREFGVRLNFTPVVRSHQKIRLRVAPEVSELDFTSAAQFQGFVIPGLTTRSMETTVELGNGATIAIAGLLSDQVRARASRIPGIGDVPVLGALFRSVTYQRSLSELVVLVTPEIVAPLDAHQTVELPTDDATTPSDMELYALGQLDSGTGKSRAQRKREAASGDDPVLSIGSQPGELSVHGPWGHEVRTANP